MKSFGIITLVFFGLIILAALWLSLGINTVPTPVSVTQNITIQ